MYALLGERRVVVLVPSSPSPPASSSSTACFIYGVDQTSGPSLIFITLPNIFANGDGMGRLWGDLFFPSPCSWPLRRFPAVLAVFENIICVAWS